MRDGWDGEAIECRFDAPPRFGITERRMAELALDAWAAAGCGVVAGFDANSVMIADPAGRAIVTAVAPAIAATFGLVAGMALTGGEGLAAELTAACDLIALRPEPVPFEASLVAAGCACILLRGVALPLFVAGHDTHNVQAVVSWREVLDRAATTRLRRELGAAFRFSPPISARRDPFAA